MLVKLATLGGAAVTLYLLIKGHIYATRKVWTPVFEEDASGGNAEDEERSGERD